VFVAYDGSPEAGVALELGTELALAQACPLRLVAIADPHDARVVAPGTGTGWAGLPITETALEAERERLSGEIDSALASLPEPLDAEGEVIVDPEPRAALVEAASEAGVLVTGSRGYGPFGRVLLGGTASSLVRKASCPVVVTPRSLIED
jgi:nucleotide-binding universal stress UspA family protein